MHLWTQKREVVVCGSVCIGCCVEAWLLQERLRRERNHHMHCHQRRKEELIRVLRLFEAYFAVAGDVEEDMLAVDVLLRKKHIRTALVQLLQNLLFVLIL